MEVYDPSAAEVLAYKRLIKQHGSGYDDGYYIYSQEGDGLGAIFGNLFKRALPLLGRAIKGTAKMAAPHFKKAASNIVSSGSKRLIDGISGNIVNRIERPRRKRRRRRI